ncbi:hypothetical protein PoB_004251300 [Plakobranchus ocellatus]|uniref:HSF-type DNA-binding domain-containing protein n=1 Tax=Plakobranchus ocellatus TaxID=259542 RepID=A0AAV4BA24_9GAST|nr:hypothetical protein PoB_004251300 [Plakobranchus ocellatus]
MPPASDLCWTYQSSFKAITEAVNNNDRKQVLIRNFYQHLTIVKQERPYYQEVYEKACWVRKGKTLVPTYDWSTFLAEYFTKIKGIKSFQHFYMISSGFVIVRDMSSDKKSHHIIIKHPHQNHMPAVMEAPGLSCQRQWYLFKEIRPFIAADKENIVARQPSIPLPKPTTGVDRGHSQGVTVSNKE